LSIICIPPKKVTFTQYNTVYIAAREFCKMWIVSQYILLFIFSHKVCTYISSKSLRSKIVITEQLCLKIHMVDTTKNTARVLFTNYVIYLFKFLTNHNLYILTLTLVNNNFRSIDETIAYLWFIFHHTLFNVLNVFVLFK